MSTERIRELNDTFRSSFGGGKVMMTPGLHELPDCVKADALVKVASFSEFTTGNDPYGEHDFGFFKIANRTMRSLLGRMNANERGHPRVVTADPAGVGPFFSGSGP
jgi:Protein of unknown function (DUF3768)